MLSRRTLAAAAALAWAAAAVSAADEGPFKDEAKPAAVPSASKAPATPLGPPPHDYTAVAAAPADAQAGAAAKKLYKRLRTAYGRRFFSGQTSASFAEVSKAVGKTPAVRAYDMQPYSPRNPWDDQWKAVDDGSVQSAIAWHAATGGRGIVSFQWHWFSPSGGKPRTSTFNTKETEFDVSKAVVPGTEEHAAVLRDLDAIALQLKKLQAAGVPVLWRPLHEAAGGWFWWGAKGPEACRKLYVLMFERFTSHHGLHNLLWVWSEPNPAWYPGDAAVDVVGYDSYPGAHKHDCQKAVFDGLYKLTGGRKLVALTETGPIPDLDQCWSGDSRWLYFLTWDKLALEQNSKERLERAFSHPAVVTAD
jgi:mannan endo-1,4-beta-mannosidase